MKIIVLSDNRAGENACHTEHGLSIYVESENRKCLFDTGASDLFIRNAAEMGIDLTQVEYVFLSHGHSDHLGGLEYFLKINSQAKVVLSKALFQQQLFSNRNGLREIGLRIDVDKYPDRFIFIDSDKTLADDVRVFKVNQHDHTLPKGNNTLFKDEGNGLEPDDFNHEIVVALGTDSLLVFTGCAHHGLLNMLDTVSGATHQPIRFVLGGFHLLDSNDLQTYETEDEIRQLSHQLVETYPDTQFFTGHCTGDKVFALLKEELGGKLNNFFVGMKLELV